jgi:hypothetical protein
VLDGLAAEINGGLLWLLIQRLFLWSTLTHYLMRAVVTYLKEKITDSLKGTGNK